MVEATPISPNTPIVTGLETINTRNKAIVEWLAHTGNVIGYSFFAPRDESQPTLPRILIGIEPMKVNQHTKVELLPDELGERYVINFNQTYINLHPWSLAEMLTHQIGRIAQETLFKKRGSTPEYHNKHFVAMMAELGLHIKMDQGYHTKPAEADGQFGRIMNMLSIDYPDAIVQNNSQSSSRNWWEQDSRPKGKSTLIRYTAEECTRRTACNVRLGRNMRLLCLDCLGVLKPDEKGKAAFAELSKRVPPTSDKHN